MHSRAIKQATKHFLQTYWGLDNCEVKVMLPPGKPLGCTSDWAITIFDTQDTFEGKIGQYVRYGCQLILSAKLGGYSINDPEELIDTPGTGFNDVKDALCAFLHTHRWDILKWANTLAAAKPLGGIITNMVESPIPKLAGPITPRGPDWWGGDVGQIHKGARTEESRYVGLSVEISFGGALTMQNETPSEYSQ